MNVYRRNFKVTSGPLIDRLVEIRAVNSKAHEEYLKIAKEIGAQDKYLAKDNLKLIGFCFDTQPDRAIYKPSYDCWMPKKSNKIGKLLDKRVDAIEVIEEEQCLSAAGVDDHRLFSSTHMHRRGITVIPSNPLLVIVSIPWTDDVSPETIAAYQAGQEHDRELEALCWAPPAEFNEIKSWEVDKIISEWNERVK